MAARRTLRPAHAFLALALLVSLGTLAWPAAALAAGEEDGVWYTVQRGDTLGGIGAQYGVSSATIARWNSLANPDLIRVGQRLWIPGGSGGSDPSPTPTPTPSDPPSSGEGSWYTVQRGDTLGGIANRYGMTSTALAQANSIANPNLIRVGQRIWIPGSSGTPAPDPSPAPSDPQPLPPSSSADFAYGFQAHPYSGSDLNLIINGTRDAGFSWIKIQVPWIDIETQGKGQYNWGELDNVVNALSGAGLRVLLSVCKAPTWARSSGTNWAYNGPPANSQDLADFLGVLVARYSGKIQAVEVWNEQNLQHEWGGEPLDAARYVDMLCKSYQAIKAQDSNVWVISGALTPTGVNDGQVAIDDVLYLQQMYQAGCKSCMDGVGVHPSGYNNPPTARMGYSDPAEPSFKGHPSFFFYETMTRYRQVMINAGDSSRALWPTEFGWASSPTPPANYEYAANVTEEEQAQYLVAALQMMRNWGYVGPAFVWNLNFGVTSPGTEQAQFSVWGRPAYWALCNMPK